MRRKPATFDLICASVQASQKGAALHQSAWLLQIAALQLHRADLALSTHREDSVMLLEAFFGSSQNSDDSGAILDLLNRRVMSHSKDCSIACSRLPGTPVKGAKVQVCSIQLVHKCRYGGTFPWQPYFGHS